MDLGKPALPTLEGHGEEEHEEKGNEDNSGESEVINPPEEAGGEASSPPGGRKPRLSKGNQSYGSKAVKFQSPRSGDEGQKAGKNESGSCSKDAALLDDSKEKRKTQKSSFQHSSNKTDEEESNCESTKPRKVGSTPSYGFTFKCDERSEKRREFYSKLEEKIHARELEINNLQAKSKETEEAELKMLRKSLNFKATPMPNFYKEPTSAKVELKKIPTTRAKSPKLGHSKNKSRPGTEENTTTNQPARPSLEEKVSQNGVKKPTSSNSTKKPQRRSLPRLPSQETGPLDSAACSSPARQLKSTNPVAVRAQETGSALATGQQLQGAEMKADSVQEANPDEQIVI